MNVAETIVDDVKSARGSTSYYRALPILCFDSFPASDPTNPFFGELSPDLVCYNSCVRLLGAPVGPRLYRSLHETKHVHILTPEHGRVCHAQSIVASE